MSSENEKNVKLVQPRDDSSGTFSYTPTPTERRSYNPLVHSPEAQTVRPKPPQGGTGTVRKPSESQPAATNTDSPSSSDSD